MPKAKIVILEGSWWSSHEVPLVLPYFNALSISHNDIDISHRTIRNVEDIDYYISKIPKSQRAMLYFACHGENMHLNPSDGKEKITPDRLKESFKKAKDNAILFVHFGCCEMAKKKDRWYLYNDIQKLTGAEWVSGYVKSVDWLASMFLDLALVQEVFVPRYFAKDRRKAPLKRKAVDFLKAYEQLAREFGFSAVSMSSNGPSLFPRRLSAK